jgi:hypothetical protein
LKYEEAIESGENIKKIGTILPPSFINGPRNMREQRLDAYAITALLGKPTFFITFTCNPDWPEIVNQLEGQTAFDRNICCRVFKLKIQSFKKKLCNEYF